MNPSHDDETHFDRILRQVKNRPMLAVLLLVGVGIVAVGQLTGAINSILGFSRKFSQQNEQSANSPNEQGSTAVTKTLPQQVGGTVPADSQNLSATPSSIPASEAVGTQAPEPVQSTSVEETPASVAEPTPVVPAGVYANESYRLSAEEVERSGTTIRVAIVLEPVDESGVTFRGGGWYLVDEHGELWNELKPDPGAVRRERAEGLRVLFRSTVRLVSGTKAKGSFVFNAAGSGQGNNFTLIGVEGEPRRGREIVVRGLTVNGN